MLTLENLASRLASDPDFRAAFAADARAGQDSLAEAEQLALDHLRGLLALPPDHLLKTLLGNSESEAQGPEEWGRPPALLPASHSHG